MVKKPKLTPEEKKLLKQEKKLAKKLALEEEKRQLKRDQLSREIKHGLLTRKKLEDKWTKMLMDIKLPMLKTDFQLAVNNVELMMDIKDFQISLLIDELDDAEEQYEFTLRAHNKNIDRILRIYVRRLDELKSAYDKSYSKLDRQTGVETDFIKEKQEVNLEYINTMNFHLEHERHKVNTELRTTYYSKLKENMTENSDDLGIMVNHHETKFENIWRAYKFFLNDYLINTAEKRKSCEQSYNNDVAICKLIQTQSAQLFNLYKILFRLKEKQTFEKEDLDKYVHYKKEESIYFTDMYRTLRTNLEWNLKHDEQKLTELVVLSNEILKDIKNKVKLCETILKVYSLIRKYEKLKEKILPFYKLAPATKMKHMHLHRSDLESLMIVGNRTTKELEPFWMKCGQSDSLRFQINEEREYLKRENVHLKQHIAKYCAGTKYSCAELKLKTTQISCYK